jgi:hypothetical protein
MTIPEQLTANFYRWERRGRGVQLFEAPVELEPPYVPFPGHRVVFEGPVDAGRKESVFSRLAGKVFTALQPPKVEVAATRELAVNEDGPEVYWFGKEDELLYEFTVRLPAGVSHGGEAMAHFFTTVAVAGAPVSLEIVGTGDEVRLMVAARVADAEVVVMQLRAHFPESELEVTRKHLESVWGDDGVSEYGVIDFGLWQEFMLPLGAPGKVDAYASLMGAMALLEEDETAVYQVLFTPLRAEWGQQALAAATKDSGKPFFPDGESLVKGAQLKASRPLYGVVLRLGAKAGTLQRVWEIIRGMSAALRLFSVHGGQSLTPLSNAGYDLEGHCEDVLKRRSRRCGMFLTIDELVSLAHLPSASVKCEKLLRVEPETEPRPTPPTDDEDAEGGIYLGIHDDEGEEYAVNLSLKRRLQHMHVLGGTGTGKSTLLLSMIQQDIEAGRGFAVIDPHGELIDQIVARIPAWRWDEVVIIDPSDEQHITPLNVLSAHSEYEKTLLASDLVSVFRRLSTSWGDRMNVIFQNLVLAFLEHKDGGTLADMRSFLVDADWRANFLEGVDDPDILFYWNQTFPNLDGAKSVGPILTRLEALLTPKIIRYMVSQRQNLVDFADIMDSGKILLVRLSQGQIGRENTSMLGSLIMVKLQQMAMSRARVASHHRRPFFCYVDECQHFVTSSMAEILSGARKYGFGLILAHQDLHQLAEVPDAYAAVMTNAATRVAFRTSEKDARTMMADFGRTDTKDFTKLPNLHALCRIERSDQVFDLRLDWSYEVDETEAADNVSHVNRMSRQRYTVPRAEVEAEVRRQMAEVSKPTAKKGGKEPKGGAKVVVEVKPEEVEKLGTSQVSEAEETAEVESPPDAKILGTSQVFTPSVVGQGVGGQDHRAAVTRMAQAGEAHGYWSRKEYDLPERQRVDLVLGNDFRKIAIEVAMTENTGHELENLKKCLAAEFDHVVSVSNQPSIVKNIRRAVESQLEANGEIGGADFSSKDLKRLHFFTLEEAESWLAELAEQDATAPVKAPTAIPKTADEAETKTIGGRRVMVKRSMATSQERQKIEEESLRMIAELLVNPKPTNVAE